jgi:SAM-dependent methyltransferase
MDKRERIQNLVGYADMHVLEQFMKGLFRVGSTLLDAGCGEGRNLHLFVDSGVRYFGLDTDRRALKMARTYLRSTDSTFDDELLQRGRLSNNHFPDACFDAVLLISVLHHCADIQEFRQELTGLKRILKPGGTVIIKMNTSQFGKFGTVQKSPVSLPFEESHLKIIKEILAPVNIQVSYHLSKEQDQVYLKVT